MQKDTFYQIRRELHQHPELSGHEARTARFVEDKLQAFHPTKVIRHVGGHGLLVEYFFSEDGPTVLFRADMDAVAVQEPDDIPHHSQTREWHINAAMTDTRPYYSGSHECSRNARCPKDVYCYFSNRQKRTVAAQKPC